ncbi:MAG: ribonuclease H-like domain-containing protein [Candidatus Bipolaricaulota bacterium]
MGKLERIVDKLLGRGEEVKKGRTNSSNRARSGRARSGSPRSLKKDLLEEYRGRDLLSVTDFEAETNDYGETFHNCELVSQSFSTPNTRPEDILSDLKLVHGIGPAREKQLKAEGIRTVRDLSDHPRWSDKAKRVNGAFRREDLSEAYRILRRWNNLSDPSLIEMAGLVDESEFAFVDIETLGLTNQPIFLLGLVRPVEDGMEIHQFLAGDPGQEMATLVRFAEELSEQGLILTYNGKNFDIPYIERRFAYYGERKKFSHPHIDLYLFARDVFGERTRNCQLNTIERSILGVRREVDIPSRLVPDFYQSYLEEANPGPLLPILAHHRQDMLSLAELFQELAEELLNEHT